MNDEAALKSKDGTEIHVRSWRPSAAPRAAVVLVHGFKAHGGLFEWAGRELAARGFAAYAPDLRGHGKSGGERYYAAKVGDYIDDVRTAVAHAKAREPARPVYLLGHSAGGVISCMYLLEDQREIAGFICESFAHEVPAPDFALAVLKGVSHIAPHLHVFKLKDEHFSRDPAFVEKMKTDPLIPRMGYPAQSVAELVRADERLKTDFVRITLPVLILHGSEDRVTMPHGSQRFADLAGSSDKTLKLYDGHYHDLLNDLGRERVLADIVEWMTVRLARRPTQLG